MQKFIEEMLTTANEAHQALSAMLPGADVSPSVDQALYGALEGLDALRKACSAHLLARRVQEALQANPALAAENLEINGVGFEVDPAQRTVCELEAE
jgi:hypothetical protein